jgi:hypothetical protein
MGKTKLRGYIYAMADWPTRKAAEDILKINLHSNDQARISVLADKSNYGTLSDFERAEYLDYVEVIDLLSILHAKARAFLARNPPSK